MKGFIGERWRKTKKPYDWRVIKIGNQSTIEIEDIFERFENYPRYHFRFATTQDTQARREREYFMTDVIGMLMSVAPINSVQISPRKVTTNSNVQISSKQLAQIREILSLSCLG